MKPLKLHLHQSLMTAALLVTVAFHLFHPDSVLSQDDSSLEEPSDLAIVCRPDPYKKVFERIFSLHQDLEAFFVKNLPSFCSFEDVKTEIKRLGYAFRKGTLENLSPLTDISYNEKEFVRLFRQSGSVDTGASSLDLGLSSSTIHERDIFNAFLDFKSFLMLNEYSLLSPAEKSTVSSWDDCSGRDSATPKVKVSVHYKQFQAMCNLNPQYPKNFLAYMDQGTLLHYLEHFHQLPRQRVSQAAKICALIDMIEDSQELDEEFEDVMMGSKGIQALAKRYDFRELRDIDPLILKSSPYPPRPPTVVLTPPDEEDFLELTEEEEELILDYSKGGHLPLNRSLRGIDSLSPEQERKAQILYQALAKMRPTPGKTFRGANLPPLVSMAMFKGKTFTLNDFWSTSQDPSVAESFTQENYIFVIEGRSGRDIQRMAHNQSEKEIIFSPGTRFEVTDRVGNFIYLRESPE